MAVTDPVLVIQATLAPVFLVSGASIFLNFLQARLFRINDRIRQVASERDATVPERGRPVLAALARRQRLVRNAILFGVVTVLLTMLTTILLVLPALVGTRVPGTLSVSVFAVGLLAFAAALFLAVEDTFLSVRMVASEVER